jgi:hypothetical protein
VQVPCDEGVAIRIGPESSANIQLTRARYKPEEIVAKLRQVDVLVQVAKLFLAAEV